VSVREARLCDHEQCNDPSVLTCSLCNRDCCRVHTSRTYLAMAIMTGHTEQHGTTGCIGRGAAIPICSACALALSAHAVGLNSGGNGPLTALVAPMTAKMVEAAAAFLAEKKLEKNDG
jgi:hypothetical protein